MIENIAQRERMLEQAEKEQKRVKKTKKWTEGQGKCVVSC